MRAVIKNKICYTNRGASIRLYILNVFFLPKTNVVGTQQNHLNEMVLCSFEHPKHMFELMGKKNNYNFMLKKICLSRHMPSRGYGKCSKILNTSCLPKKAYTNRSDSLIRVCPVCYSSNFSNIYCRCCDKAYLLQSC